MPHYMLLLYDDPSYWQKLSPEEMQKLVEKYLAWRHKPFTLDGKKLARDPGHLVRQDAGVARATDGPYSETKEVLGGYYTIEAANYEEAVARSMDHPHVGVGTIEIRHVFGT